MNETKLEAEIQAKGLTAPRITPARIDEVIIGGQYWQPEGTTLTVCAMKLANGTMVVGESACVSESNFDAEIGKKIAYDNARNKIWALEGYLLKQNLSNFPPENNKREDYFLPIENTKVYTDEDALAQLQA